MSYIAPIDETKFWLYEILEAERLFSLSNFQGLKGDDLNLILSEAAKITSCLLYTSDAADDLSV